MSWKLINGVREGTTDNFVIGPGVMYKGFKSVKDLGEMLGATTGGCKVGFTREYYDADIDGVLGKLVRGKWLLKDEPHMEVTLVEFTKENLELALPGVDVDSTTDNDYNIVKPTNEIKDTSYSDIAIVGVVSGSDIPVIFVIRNAMVVSSVEIDLKDGKGTVGLKCKFIGHYSEGSPNTPPYEIYLPKKKAPKLPTTSK
ncbi:putative phage structural protein (plasmid) [Bacillus thuringiensis MC28]|nr:putative phage structural protein [Bacillus thuringiensis MC28]